MLIKTGLVDVGVLETLRTEMTSDIIQDDWKIKKHSSNNYLFLEQVGTCTWFSDKVDFIENFFDKIYNREFNSILCGGLGLGVVPSLVQSFCTKIDVVEISQSNIDLINNHTSHLGSNVNIIHGDIKTHNTSEMYDVILIDVWTCDLDAFYAEKDSLITKYTPNLNPGGLLYIPLDGWYPTRP